MGAVITGVGVALPDKTVTNADLEARMDTTDAWIVERTGIHERRIGGTTAGLAAEAGSQALARAGLEPGDIDLLILATTSPDRAVPATSATVAAKLGLPGGAMDVNAACTGFVYGLVAAHGVLGLGGSVRRVLLVGAETLSRITDWEDRGTAILFADGAGAAVVEASEGPGQLLGWDLGADGNAESILYADHGDFIRMEGREVFRRATRVMVESSHRALAMAGLTPDDVDLIVPHQANIRIIKAANERLGIPLEKTAIVIHRTGNSSSATIPTALCDAIEHGRVHDGSIVLLVGFGAGMTWASAVLRWGEGRPSRR
jgi:3-oxoacyl-[acyl-carrier-protein] synthase III